MGGEVGRIKGANESMGEWGLQDQWGKQVCSEEVFKFGHGLAGLGELAGLCRGW